MKAAVQGLSQEATFVLVNFLEVFQVGLVSKKNEASWIDVFRFQKVLADREASSNDERSVVE